MNNIKEKIDQTKKNLRERLANDEFNTRWKENKKGQQKKPEIKEYPLKNQSLQQKENKTELKSPLPVPPESNTKPLAEIKSTPEIKNENKIPPEKQTDSIQKIQYKPAQIQNPQKQENIQNKNNSSFGAGQIQTGQNQQKPIPKPEIKTEKNFPSNPDSKLVDSYKVRSGGAEIEVRITKEIMGMRYSLTIPQVEIATQALLGEVRNELVSISNVNMKELIDPDAFEGIKQKFTNDAIRVIKKKLPNINQKTQDFLVERLIQDMLGLGKIEFMINDPILEEIVIVSSKEPIRVFSKKYGWLETNITVEKEENIVNYSNIIARRVGRQINILNPLLDAHLVTGDRINAVLYPINTKGSTITIRKFARDPYTIVDLIGNKTCDSEVAALIWLAMEYEMNILISGGTASGKTVFLNSCLPFIPPNQRILSIEDTRELMLPEFLYWTPLVTRTPNPEGKGEVSMLDLLVNSLRMRPDRIILGEMRKQEEAMVLFEAMHTGHSVYATLHADSASETISRLINPPLSVPANLLKSVNLNVVMFRDRRRGIRRISQIAEIEAENGNAKANILYRWIPEEDKIVKHAANSRLYEDLGRHTGMSQNQIEADLKKRKEILLWLVKNNLRDLENFGNVMNLYYRNRDILEKAIRENNPKLLKIKDGV